MASGATQVYPNWVTVAGAVAGAKGEVIMYENVPGCGSGMMQFQVARPVETGVVNRAWRWMAGVACQGCTAGAAAHVSRWRLTGEEHDEPEH
jgi:hypothetical protein